MNTIQKIIESYKQQAKASYKAIKIIAETYLIDEDSLIVEGYQITPEIVNQTIEKKGSKKIRAVFLTKKNEAEFVKNIHKSTTPNDWILRRTKKESTFSKIAKMVSMYSNYFEKNAKKHNFKVLNTDYNFDETIDEAISYLVMK